MNLNRLIEKSTGKKGQQNKKSLDKMLKLNNNMAEKKNNGDKLGYCSVN